MRIVFWHFYTFRFLRGIETLIISLANALVRQGVEVSIVTASATKTPLVQPDPRVKIYAFPTTRYYSHLFITPYYLNHFLRHQYDNVTVFFADFGEGLTWRFLNRFRNLPLTLYLCYAYSAVPHRYRSFLQLGWHEQAKHILADGAWFAKEAEELFHRPVSVVPVGTDAERFAPNQALRNELRAQWGFSDSDVVLLNVSALERQKGTWRVIESVGRLRDRFPNLQYFILGEGDDESTLRAAVKDFQLGDRVTFGGTTSRLEAYYNMADIFVMLPDDEANSIACHEAMSCGLPVIVSDTRGFKESVPLEAGFLADPDNRDELDSVLTQMISDPELRQRAGRAGRSHILSHCTWDQIARQYLEAIR